MNKEYIEREALIKLIEENSETKFDWSESVDIDVLRPAIRDIPAADVAPVLHGKWESFAHGSNARTCSNCHISQTVNVYNDEVMYNYCPYCGAKMDGGKNNDK